VLRISSSAFTALSQLGICGCCSRFAGATYVPHKSLDPVRAIYLEDFGLYWVLAEQRHGREATLARLKTLAQLEWEALSGVLADPHGLRMHSVGVAGG